MPVKIKRIYEPSLPSDGYRVLVDRLWPRGMKKEAAQTDLWLKEIAPSTELRKWFNHEQEKWPSFIKKYAAELEGSAALKELTALAGKYKTLTILYSAKETQFNHAVILYHLLKGDISLPLHSIPASLK